MISVGGVLKRSLASGAHGLARGGPVPGRANSSRPVSGVQRQQRRSLYHYSLDELGVNDRETTLFVPNRVLGQKEEKKVKAERASLKEPFEGLKSALDDHRPADFHPTQETKVTKMPNGMIVASEDSFSQMTSVGLYVKAGSRYEDSLERGSSQVLERLMFRTTANHSHAEVIGMLEDMGATATSTTFPDMLVLSGEVLRQYVDSYLKIVSDSLTCPVFSTEEVQEQVGYLLEDIEARKTSVHTVLSDALHELAYKGSPLANTPPSLSLRTLTAESLYQYMKRTFIGPRMVVAAASADHDELVQLTQKHFGRIPSMPTDGSMPAVSPIGLPLMGSLKSRYTGGMQVIPMEPSEDEMDPVNTVAVAFEGVSLGSNDLHLMFTLSSIMGGGDSFSSGGPGKGIHSRLYRNVLSKYYFVSHCSTFIHSYADTSLFGLMADCEPKHTDSMLDIICHELVRMMDSLDEVAVERGKNALKTQIFYNLESRAVVTDDIARYMLALGRRYSAAEICANIDHITVASIQAFAAQLLRSRPTVVAVGQQKYLRKLPDYAAVEAYFERSVAQYAKGAKL